MVLSENRTKFFIFLHQNDKMVVKDENDNILSLRSWSYLKL